MVIYFRGDLRRPRTRVGQGSERSQCSAVCVVKHCRNWSAILLASSGVHYRTHLRIIPSDRQGNWDICPPPLYLSALNGCSQGQEVLHCVKAEHATSQKAEGHRPSMHSGEYRGAWRGTNSAQYILLPSCSLPTQRPQVTFQSANLTLTLLCSIKKGIWMILKNNLVHFP